MLNNNEWLKRARRFDLGKCIIYNKSVSVESRGQRDGSIKWVLKMDECLLGKDGEFHYERQASSRTDEFISNTRFGTRDECYSFWQDTLNKAR